MSTEKFPPKQPETDPDFPMTDLEIVPTSRKDAPHPGVIIGPELLDIDNLPGSKPLEDEDAPDKPHLNS